MSNPDQSLPDTQFQRDLRVFAHSARYPETPDVWPAIAGAIETLPTRGARRRRQATVAFAAVAGAVALAFAVPPARSAILRFFGLDGVSIVRVGRLPPLSPPSASMLGVRATLAQAQGAVPFAIRLVDGKAPDAVFVGEDVPPAVVIVYGTVAHPRLLLSEFRPCCGQDTIEKEVPRGVAVKSTDVDGERAVWIGGPHLVRSGGHARLAGETLIWRHDGVLYRLEAHLSKDEARHLAAKLRAK